jgi:hypothetical protein
MKAIKMENAKAKEREKEKLFLRLLRLIPSIGVERNLL